MKRRARGEGKKLSDEGVYDRAVICFFIYFAASVLYQQIEKFRHVAIFILP